MNIGNTLFAQVMDVLPWKAFHRIVSQHDGDRYVKLMTCAYQFRVMPPRSEAEIAALRTRGR